MTNMEFTSEDVIDLRKAYENCEKEVFVFKGSPFLKAYAKYLLEYLEGIPDLKES